LLGLIACLAPDAIPRSLLEAAVADPLRLDDGLAALGRHSLIAVDSQGVEVHRLVQAVAWDRMSREAQARHAERAVTLLEAAFPRESHDVRTWGVCKVLQPHADHASRLSESWGIAPGTVGDLLDRVGAFDGSRARFKDAGARFRRAIRIKEAAFGLESTRLANLWATWATSSSFRGTWRGRRVPGAGAAESLEAALRPDHPEVARTWATLGIVARAQGDLAEARRCQERALRIN
jgi:tetratricopeptide (TPR) repeat protein